jgi:hypothetical protein
VRFAALAYLCLWLMCLVAGTLLWAVARAAGIMASVEHLVGQLASSPNFHFDGAKVMVLSAGAALLLAVLGAAGVGVATMFLNLAADVVGGVEIAVEDQGRPAR